MHVPAYVLDHAWTARAWNEPAAALFVGWLDVPQAEKNLLRYVFLEPRAQTLIADWPERSRRLVAEFHSDFSRRPRDAGMGALGTICWHAARTLPRCGVSRPCWRARGSACVFTCHASGSYASSKAPWSWPHTRSEAGLSGAACLKPAHKKPAGVATRRVF